MNGPEAFLTDLFGLRGQVAVVIGGTGVLGGAIAQGLAQAGARVVVSGLGVERGAQRVRQIEAAGGEAAFVAADVTARPDLERLAAAAHERFGSVDIVVNGAGVNSASSYLEVADDDWDRVLRCNLSAVHWSCQIFGRRMIDGGRGGAIINIASVTAHRPLSRVFAYSVAKAGVVNLTRNVAREFAPQGVRVNAICPGFFPAEQNRKILDAQRTAQIMAQTPLARFGEPQELVGGVLLLASPRAGSFITGTCLYVDGGFTAMRL
ncbi:MAG: SDR family oxidoreductase [Pirellulales bacterium]|nr:SDR family oxidoreductase [Pirellulales bacterium]